MKEIAAARLWAVDRFPYFGNGLFALTPVEAPGLGTFAVDRRWRLYVDPEVLQRWTVPEIGAVLVHELYHVLRDHHERGAALDVGPDEALAWNVACDAEINDDLVAMQLPLPGSPVIPRSIGCKDGQLAEAYYAQLPEDLSIVCECGSGAHGIQRGFEAGTEVGGLDRSEAVLVRRQVAADVRAMPPGTVPKELRRWADASAEAEEVIDWRVVLATEVRRAVHLVAGRVDYSYRRPSRRSSALPGVVLPSFVRPVPSVAVVVDTSGSMHDAQVAACLEEIDSIVEAVGLRAIGVTVLACDAAVHEVSRVVHADRVRLTGGGGTDLRLGIDAALRLRVRPDVIVVLTDGFTPWPARQPHGVRVVVGLLDPRTRDAVPAWARCVDVA